MLKCVVVLCGKRKSGKDFVAEELARRFTEQVAVVRLSEPLKRQYALNHNLDLTRLLDASEYKEQHRQKMIEWGESKRQENPRFFCDLATATPTAQAARLWIVSDARRQSDMDYFMTNYGAKLVTVRVFSEPETRARRGYVFTAGVDDVESECGLDQFAADVTLTNNDGSQLAFQQQLNDLEKLIEARLQS